MDSNVSTDTMTMSDQTLMAELREESARWATRDELEAGFAPLFAMRDEAVRRRLPLPETCPREDPLS
jgi:hypothetical protein